MKKKSEINNNEDFIDSLLGASEFKDRFFGVRCGEDVDWPERISTGSVLFDLILEGGYRCGWSRFCGDEESGKTSMGLVWAKNWQEHFGEDAFVLYFNAEGRLTKDLIVRSGINTDKSKFRIIDSNKGDFVFSFIEKICLLEDGKRYFFMVDSTDALIRQQDEGKGFDEPEKIGGGATLQSLAGKRLSLPISTYGHHLYMVSQLRDKMSTGPMGGGKGASGGNAPKYYSSLTGQFQKPWSDTYLYADPSDKKSKIIGRLATIKLQKTPNETTGTIVQYPVKHGLVGGVWPAYEAYMIAMSWNLLLKAKAWYNFTELFFDEFKTQNPTVAANIPLKMQGEKAVIEVFENNPVLVDFIFHFIRNAS